MLLSKEHPPHLVFRVRHKSNEEQIRSVLRLALLVKSLSWSSLPLTISTASAINSDVTLCETTASSAIKVIFFGLC